MGRVISIPFAKASRAVGAKEIEQLKSALQAPQVANLVKDRSSLFDSGKLAKNRVVEVWAVVP
jgi:hypothetical protein